MYVTNVIALFTGLMEDLEDMRMEAEEKKRSMKRRRLDDDDDD